MKKIVPLILAAALLCLSLAGCGGTAPTNAASETAAPAPVPTEVIPDETTPEADPTESVAVQEPPVPDFMLGEGFYPADSVVMTVDGVEINWAWYYSAVRQYAASFYQYYGIYDYDMVLGSETETIGDWLREEAENELKSTALMYAWAEELGLDITEADEQYIEDQIQQRVDDTYGGDRDALFAALGVTEDFLLFQWKAALLSEDIQEYYFGENGETVSDEDAIAFISDEDWLYAKHILYKTVDDAGDPLPEEEIEERRAAAEAALEQLKAADPEELPALFDQLMMEESEDTGLAYYPDGYYFQTGEMVAAFEDAARNLQEDHFTADIVESNYGFHILYRPAMSGDHVFSVDSSGPTTLREYAAAGLFDNMAEERYEALTVEYSETFRHPSLTELFYTEPPVDHSGAAEDETTAED